MQRLLDFGLLQAGLVRLDTPALVGRYNQCLQSAGIQPVDCQSLTIDGAGWSPEVAKLMQNNFYLCHDLANPMAILISPEQFKKPVYFPTYSWMRRALRSLFDRSYREITDVTATNGIVNCPED